MRDHMSGYLVSDPLRRLMKKIDVQRDRWRSKMRSVKDNVELHDVGMSTTPRSF